MKLPICMSLTDVEGSELDALRGAQKLIASATPLINFGYNADTRSFFEVAQATDQLGAGHQIYRLHSEVGQLDQIFSETWNVVALPQRGPWQQLNQQAGQFLE